MRVASWVLVLCAALCAAGAFLPALELQVHGSLVKRADLSLYKITSDRATARRLLARNRSSGHRRTGAQVIHSVALRVGGKLRAALDDARDAMDTLDDVSDDDARLAGGAVVGALCGLIGLDAILAGLVVVELVRGSARRRRHVLALLAALAAAVIAVGVHLGCRAVAWRANDEVGLRVMQLGTGAYVMPLAALAALLLAIALVARGGRAPARPVR